jgi:hypothetical protein
MLLISFVLQLAILPISYFSVAYRDKKQFVRNEKLCNAVRANREVEMGVTTGDC